ncbi:MAG: DUF2911 domain-containing protein [Chitinophagales bacterium]|nr:DUF2911 domain-containing protein [Chitinophagales bacterium]
MKTNSNILKALFLSTGLLAFGIQNSDAQKLKTPTPSPHQTLTQEFALSQIEIDYSRPSAKGRTIFGDLVPYGKVWRTGANASTTIEFGDDVKVNGKELKAGKYALFTIPDKDTWKVSFYKDLKLGGNVANYDEKNEVITIEVPVQKVADKVETFTISVDNLTDTKAMVSLTWENTRVSFDVTTEIDERIMTDIKNVMGDNKPYAVAASYYMDNGKDLNQAYEWLQKAVDNAPYAYWLAYRKAKLELMLGQYQKAIESANTAKAKAEEAQSADYVKLNNDLISEAKSKLKK